MAGASVLRASQSYATLAPFSARFALVSVADREPVLRLEGRLTHTLGPLVAFRLLPALDTR